VNIISPGAELSLYSSGIRPFSRGTDVAREETMIAARRQRSLFGDVILILFLLAQVCDGAFTYIGVQTFGLHAEGNPIVGWYIAAVGAGLALVGTKALAIGCAAVLHAQARHRTIGFLTIIYLTFAVIPWIDILLNVD
jgi:hypothetical protein